MAKKKVTFEDRRSSIHGNFILIDRLYKWIKRNNRD